MDIKIKATLITLVIIASVAFTTYLYLSSLQNLSRDTDLIPVVNASTTRYEASDYVTSTFIHAYYFTGFTDENVISFAITLGDKGYNVYYNISVEREIHVRELTIRIHNFSFLENWIEMEVL